MKTRLIRLCGCLLAVIALCGYAGSHNQADEPPTVTVAEIPAFHSLYFEPWEIHNIDVDAEEPPEEPPPAPEAPLGELLTLSGLTAAELESGLLGELKPLAPLFLDAEEETGINAVFLAAVAAYESGWNTSSLAIHSNNLFGWSSGSGYRYFESKEDCIAFVAEQIKANYLSPDGIYFNGYTVEGVNVRYNGNPQWAATVSQIMREIESRIEGSGNHED